ncbi:MAG: class A beta-lactamase-related serine hydrolase [Desulfuromonadales bacterium]|nr:MAG: class A beta-lactamase-related serine hydrolase [Desulfuromonadales bacterium]
MVFRKFLTLVLFLCASLPVFAGDTPLVTPDRQPAIGQLMEKALADGLIAGGVVLVGTRHGVVYEAAFGRVSNAPDAPPVTTATVFDAASLTKVVATTPAVMKLAEEGKLSLVDPVIRWFPEFVGRGKDEVLVVHLLTHSSGLDDVSLSVAGPLQSAVEGAATQRLKGEPGHRFKYADINFILLGELVRRVSGVSLDRYAAETFYRPLAMVNSCFNPDSATVGQCAATLDAAGMPLFGKVQDYSARLMDGVAGHAGLFASAGDLARFCRMILGEGELSGHRVLEARTVRQMTAPYFSRGGKVARGLGWDIASPYSAPKGNGFSESSFGHTGYSGGSIWIDPDNDAYVIVLSARLDYRNTRAFGKLRSDISSLAFAMLFPDLRELVETALREPLPFR